jgi:hypothetical protein
LWQRADELGRRVRGHEIDMVLSGTKPRLPRERRHSRPDRGAFVLPLWRPRHEGRAFALALHISCVHASAKLRCANSSGTVKTPTRCPRLGSGCGVGEPPLAASVVSKCAAARMRPLWSYSARICMPIEICTRPTGSGGQASQRDEPDCIKDRDRSPFRG